MQKLMLSLLIFSCFSMQADKAVNRLNKKEKQELIEMFVEFIDGMERNCELPIKEQLDSRWWFWQNPMTRIERAIDQLTQIAEQIQNYVLDLHVAHHEGHHAKECCKELSARMGQIELLLTRLIPLLIEDHKTLGDREDESVGEQEFNSVQDIDEAELSLVSLLKSVYREQLKDKFIS